MEKRKKRLRLVGLAASLAALVGMTYLSLPAAVAFDEIHELSFDVCVDVADRIDIVNTITPNLHPFHVFGVIFERGGTTPIGDYRCWGWRNPGEVSVISQVYNIDGHGSIATQGLEVFAIGATRPVVGGDGDFTGLRGVGIIGRSFVDGFKPAGCSDSDTVIGFEIDFDHLPRRR